jgi:flagellar hook-basal body complex protein FliE
MSLQVETAARLAKPFNPERLHREQKLPLTMDRPLMKEEEPRRPGFGDTLKAFIADVNQKQVEKEEISARFLAGEVLDVHEAMVAMEKANVSFRFLLEVRNKLQEGYREIMRMQV